MSILILSTTRNTHADAVETEAHRHGAQVVRINLDAATAGQVEFSVPFPGAETILLNGLHLQPAEVTGVFVHHPFSADCRLGGVDPLDADLIRSSWRNALEWLEGVLTQAVWVNKVTACRESASPYRQLSVARQHGLRVPQTIFTNSVDELRRFARDKTRTLAKSGPLYGVDLKDGVLRSHLIDSFVVDPESLRLSPCIIQEYIHKAFELRIHVIVDQVLSCRIDSQACEQTKIDWRNYRLPQTPHSAFTLDGELATTLIAITKDLKLSMGVIDMIVTPEGKITFLEINSQGHWLWIEELTSLRITEALIKVLINVNKASAV